MIGDAVGKRLNIGTKVKTDTQTRDHFSLKTRTLAPLCQRKRATDFPLEYKRYPTRRFARSSTLLGKSGRATCDLGLALMVKKLGKLGSDLNNDHRG